MPVPHWAAVLISRNNSFTRLISFQKNPQIISFLAVGSVPQRYAELQPLLSGVHSVMRVKLALAGEGGGCTPTPSLYIYLIFTFTITSKVAVYAPAVGEDTQTLFHL
jgi:hypothetical protein